MHRLMMMLAAAAITVAGVLGQAAMAAGADPKIVRVGGYQFAPYVSFGEGGTGPHGLTVDLIALLNRTQDRWRFQLVPTTPLRRYDDFARSRFDVMFFEMAGWGWSRRDIPLDVSKGIATDREVFIAQLYAGRDKSWFAGVRATKIAAMLGYHYAFADFAGDPDQMRRRFDLVLVNDNAAVIELVLLGRVEAGVVTQSFLSRYLADRPNDLARLLVSDQADQLYDLRVLTRPGRDPDAAAIYGLLARLDRDGRLAPLWRAYGLDPVRLGED
ncbi:ABC transporter substrate-binding protein [uncultured Tistrella sp.]|uniref:substrate-binding periplasmic protein n=1 Tax=Tistrella mobilis TaxID=171437 RepID=UPI000C09BEFF|nr:ABC transporter substrate-binding protein [uncultured Tistrella sp.]MAM74945.1 amino acid ABC transporter substrate-binding protein [Tistrella sp.]